MFYSEAAYNEAMNEGPLATMGDAHREWHRNAGVPMGTAGCPQDACHPMDVYDAMTDEALAVFSDEVAAFHAWQDANVPDEDDEVDLDLFFDVH